MTTAEFIEQSIRIITEHQAESGAYIASLPSDRIDTHGCETGHLQRMP